jgi:hypothetical protein
MWINTQSSTKKIECWAFYVYEEKDIENLKGVITKCVFEA